MRRSLFGVGVGPGDPELLTCRAVRVLREADVVLVPATENSGEGPGRAERSVLAHLEPSQASKVARVAFSMAEAGRQVAGPRQENWEAAAAVVLEAFADGCTKVAFATIGDPSVYSTFSYLAERVLAAQPDVRVEVVPGITAMQALAAASRTPLVEGTESLTLVPATAGLAALTDALEHSDTVVAYKGGRYLPAMIGELRARGRLQEAVLGEEVGLPEQRIRRLAELSEGARAGYLTTVIVPAARSRTGGRL